MDRKQNLTYEKCTCNAPRARVSRLVVLYACGDSCATSIAAASLCGLPFPDALGKRRRRMSEWAQQPDDQAKWVTEADIDRAAKLVIELRGAGAYDRAFQRFGDLSLTGDDEAAAIWRRIVKAIERLQA